MKRSQRITTSPVSIVETQSSAFTSGIRRIATRLYVKTGVIRKSEIWIFRNLKFGI